MKAPIQPGAFGTLYILVNTLNEIGRSMADPRLTL